MAYALDDLSNVSDMNARIKALAAGMTGIAGIYNTSDYYDPLDDSYAFAIKKATDAMLADPGGWMVWIPPNSTTYELAEINSQNKCILLYSNMVLSGGGTGKTKLKMRAGSKAHMIVTVNYDEEEEPYCKNWVIQGLSMDGNGDEVVQKGFHIVRLADCVNGIIQDCDFTNPRAFALAHFPDEENTSRHITLRRLGFSQLNSEGIDFHVARSVNNRFTGVVIDDIYIEGMISPSKTRSIINVRGQCHISNITAVMPDDPAGEVTLIELRGSAYGTTVDQVNCTGRAKNVITALGHGFTVSNIYAEGARCAINCAANYDDNDTSSGNGRNTFTNIFASDVDRVIGGYSDNNTFLNVNCDDCIEAAVFVGSNNFAAVKWSNVSSGSSIARTDPSALNNGFSLETLGTSPMTRPFVLNEPAYIERNGLRPTIAVSASFRCSHAETGCDIAVTTGSSDKSVTLPIAGLNGRVIGVSKADSGSGDVLISNGAANIYVIDTLNMYVQFKDTGSAWVPLHEQAITPPPPPPPSVADFTLNFAAGLYDIDGGPIAFADVLSLTRASEGWAESNDGTWRAFAANVPRITDKGLLRESARTAYALWCRDLTQTAWAASNVDTFLDQTGIGGSGGSLASRLDATANNGTVLQSITLASAAYTFSPFVKRLQGTGAVYITINGGTNWTDVSSLIDEDDYARVYLSGTLANPSVGFKVATLGDSIAIDFAGLEGGAFATSPIVVTTASATRATDALSFTTPGLVSITAGTLYAEWEWSVLPSLTARLFYIWKTSTSDRVLLSTDSNNKVSGVVTVSGASTFAATSTNAGGVGTRYRSGLSYQTNGFAAGYSASLQSAATTSLLGAVPSGSPTGVGLGADPAGNNVINAYLSQIRYRKVAESASTVLAWTQA